MQVCDLCGRTDKQAKCEQYFIHFDSGTRWQGHLCGDCRKRVAESLRTLVPSPSPDAAPFATPTPKQAYVMDVRPKLWIAVLAWATLALLSMGTGVFATLAYLKH